MLIDLKNGIGKSLTQTEINVVDWLNQHEKDIPFLSINVIADASYVSLATVSRTIRKCGFSGIAELKYRISSKINYVAEEKIANQIFNRTMTECKKTFEALNINFILRTVNYIKYSDRIYLVARGNTALIANDFAFQLQLLGYNAFVLSDSQIMKNSCKLFKKNDIVFILTAKNSTPELEIAARFAKTKEAIVILCCCIREIKLEQYADLSLLGGLINNNLIEEFQVVSHLPLQICVRTLIDYLVIERELKS